MKKHISVFTVGACAVALTVGLVLMTLLVASGSFRYRKTKLVIQTGSASKTYDGNPLESKVWHILSGEVSKEHELTVEVKGQQTVVGTSENIAKVIVRDSAGKDVTDQYDIEMKYGTLEILRRKLTFTSESGWKVYNGTPLVVETVNLSGGHLSSGETFEAYDFADPTEPGKHLNTFRVRIMDAYGEEITDNYDVSCEPGELLVMYGQLVVTTASDSKEYDGTPLTNLRYDIKSGSINPGHRTEVTVTGSLTLAGISNNTIRFEIYDAAGTNITDLYKIDYELGLLTVTPRKLVVRTKDVVRPYYDTVIKNDWELVAGELLPGDTLEVLTMQQLSGYYDPGTYDNTVYSYTLRNQNYWDISDCYAIYCQTGVYVLTE
ncbi:MAG: hypothetical protein J5649_06765 [Lachnospiraceae bacterium]|nr:hypothetical protein [Lachnospiraceae bacterium]